MKKWVAYRAVLSMALVSLMMQGCAKDPLPDNYHKPNVTLHVEYEPDTFHSIRLTSEFSDTRFTECGLWYWTEKDRSDECSIPVKLSDDRTWSEAVISDLEPGITYYMQSYVRSNETLFTSSSSVSMTIPSTVNLSKPSLSLVIGDEDTISATILPTNSSVNNKCPFSWTSSDPSIATVRESRSYYSYNSNYCNAIITAKAAGRAIIKVRCQDLSATCIVSVSFR